MDVENRRKNAKRPFFSMWAHHCLTRNGGLGSRGQGREKCRRKHFFLTHAILSPVKKTTAADHADHDHEYMVPGMVPDGARTKSAQWRVEQKWDRLHGLCQIDFAQAGPTLRPVHAAAWFLLERCAMSTQNPYESPRDLEPGYSPRQAPEDRNLAWLLFSFHGRIPRSVYWAAVIVAWLALIAVAVIASVLFPALDADTGAVVGLLFIPPYVAYVWVNLAHPGQKVARPR